MNTEIETATSGEEKLMEILRQQGKNVRKAVNLDFKIVGGTAVITTNAAYQKEMGIKNYTVGIIGGGPQALGTGQDCSIMYNYSAFKGPQGYCSCSGGPGTICTPFECLRPTGLEIEISFWRWKDGIQGADRGEHYKEFVHLYDCYQTMGEALSKKKEITKERWDELFNCLPPIYIDSEDSFTNDWERDEHGKATMWREAHRAFAVSEPYNHTDETVVLAVCFWETYKKWENNQWEKAAETKYFEQLMLVYTPDFKPISDTYFHQHGKNYRARKYYTHSKEHQQEMSRIDSEQYNLENPKKPIYTYQRDELQLLLAGYTTKYIIYLIKTMDAAAEISDEAYIAAHGRPALRTELLEVFWNLYDELQPLVKG